MHPAQLTRVLHPLLGPHERLLAIPEASYVIGPETIDGPVEENPDVERLRQVLAAMSPGQAVYGAPQSLGVTLRQAIHERRHGGHDGDLLDTTDRLVVVDKPIAGARVIWQCRRDQVAVAKVTSGIGYAGRVVVVFTDGSGIALLLGIVFKGAAVRLVAELNAAATHPELAG